jgi:hypothetical protein
MHTAWYRRYVFIHGREPTDFELSDRKEIIEVMDINNCDEKAARAIIAGWESEDGAEASSNPPATTEPESNTSNASTEPPGATESDWLDAAD